MTQREKVVGDTSITFVVLVVGDTAANARDSGSRDLGLALTSSSCGRVLYFHNAPLRLRVYTEYE